MPNRSGRPPFLGELKRRQVFKVSATYAVVAFIVLQVADLVADPLGLPAFTMTLVIVILVVGFPAALALAWVFELTDEGLKVDEEARLAAEAEAAASLQQAVRASRVRAPISERSIAVLPFANLSGDAENEYFSDGITDDLILVLSRIGDLHVISRTSVMRYKGTTLSLGSIAEDLRVRTILEGSVRRSGDRVRISARLVDAAADRNLWVESYDRGLEDIFAIQSDVSNRIASALAAELSPQERDALSRKPTEDVEAYELYLKGRHLWNRRTADGLARSIDFFRRALARDPRFALAEAGLADTFVTQGIYGLRPPGEVMPAARDAAARALAADESQAEALTALAAVRSLYEWDWTAAERDYRRAIDLQPRYALAHQWLASNLLAPLSRFDEARVEMERASELDPVSPVVAVSAGVLSLYAGDAARAVEVLTGVIDVHDEFGIAHYFLGMALEDAGDSLGALEALAKAARLTGESPEVLAAWAHALGRAGRPEAETIAARLEARAAVAYVSPVLLAQVRLGRGDEPGALDLLEAAAEGRALDLVWLGVRPCYRPLKGNPRFEALVRRVGLGR